MRRSITVLLFLILVLGACSEAAEIAEPAASTVRTSPTSTSSTDQTSGSSNSVVTVSPSPESTAEVRVPLDRVFITVDGVDGQSGADAANAVASLEAAIPLLAPGGSIVFQPGTYPPLQIENIRGEMNNPIRLEADGEVEFRDNDYRSGAAILVRDSEHLEIKGMRTRQALWGIYVENSQHIFLDSNNVGDVGQEGIRVKSGSSHIRIEGNTIADTGLRSDQSGPNGEGIYIGTGTPAGVDVVSNISIINNRILRTTDEAIDIKRPSTNIDIIGNTISDINTQTTGAIVIHLNAEESGDPQINVERNTITNVTRQSPHRDGNCIVSQVTVRIVNNVLLNCEHRGIFLKGSQGTATLLHNTLISTGSVGAIVDEGNGMLVVSENNLGADGESNRQADAGNFVDPVNGDFQLRDEVIDDLTSAPNLGVSNDITGDRRPASGTVTFGAVEMAGSAS